MEFSWRYVRFLLPQNSSISTSLLIVLLSYSFSSQFLPIEPYLVPYLTSVKHFTNFQVTVDIYPYSVYAQLIFTLLLVPACIHFSHKVVIILGAFGVLLTYLIIWAGQSLLAMQIMQITYGFGIASRLAFSSYIFLLVPEEEYQTMIHSKRRNRLEHKRLNDLVYVRYNQILHHRYKKRDSIDPISLKDIDDSNEWLTGQMESLDLDEGVDGTGAPDLVFPGEDLDWAMVSEAAGVDEPQARTRAKGKAPASTSNVYQRRGRARQAQVEEEEEEDVDVDEDEDEDEEEEFVCDDDDSDDYPEEDVTYDNDSP